MTNVSLENIQVLIFFFKQPILLYRQLNVSETFYLSTLPSLALYLLSDPIGSLQLVTGFFSPVLGVWFVEILGLPVVGPAVDPALPPASS